MNEAKIINDTYNYIVSKIPEAIYRLALLYCLDDDYLKCNTKKDLVHFILLADKFVYTDCYNKNEQKTILTAMLKAYSYGKKRYKYFC